jgi:hypothetical protein
MEQRKSRRIVFERGYDAQLMAIDGTWRRACKVEDISDNRRGCVMTGHTQLAITPRDRFLETAQKELIAFEQREREFLKRDREERAAKLQIPLNKIAAHNY